MIEHFKPRPRLEVEVPLIALLDIIFLLLVYFLLTTNFISDEGIKVKLPQAKASAPRTEMEITVYVDREGRAFIGREEVAHARLFDHLKDMINGREDKLVVVKADRSVMLNRVVKVMDIAKAAGAGKLCLATEKDF
ncbi:MAG: biopolymer transporter ExbD [Thermodesulfobacteriota bacterium]|nr:biopolymer transporter ExbD [Thermodesulfobacteriota bacterium]